MSGLWGQLNEVISGVVGPLVIGGDFNTIVRVDERAGGSGTPSTDSLAFGDWINENSLIDMGFNGKKFTWKRGHVLDSFVAKRLDRVLCCAQARLRWQEAIVTHLPFLSSNHSPLYVQLTPAGRSDPKRRPFRFEAAWLSHSGFKELMQTSWKRELTTPEALKMLQTTLRRWNKEVFGDICIRKEKIMNELTTLQNSLEHNQTDELLEKEAALLREFDVVLEQEEMMWF